LKSLPADAKCLVMVQHLHIAIAQIMVPAA
jgi:hypothetical protein